MEAYARRAYPLYRPQPRAARHGHGAEGDRAAAEGRLNGWLTRVGLWFLRRRASKLAAQGA